MAAKKFGDGERAIAPPDLLATLLNEPLVGHGIFWSSAAGTDRGARPYPLPIRVLSFEAENHILRDPAYNGDAVDCYASRLRATFRSALAAAGASTGSAAKPKSAQGSNFDDFFKKKTPSQ